MPTEGRNPLTTMGVTQIAPGNKIHSPYIVPAEDTASEPVLLSGSCDSCLNSRQQIAPKHTCCLEHSKLFSSISGPVFIALLCCPTPSNAPYTKQRPSRNGPNNWTFLAALEGLNSSEGLHCRTVTACQTWKLRIIFEIYYVYMN